MRDITVYKCDTCDRTVQIARNPHGIETVGRCIITQNCRGRLYVEDLILTTSPFVKRTPDVVGLTNFYPRKKLGKFIQTFSKQSWLIKHDLETFPIISVYDDDKTPISNLDYEVDLIDSNTVSINFNVPTSGTVEMYVREISTATREIEQSVSDDVFHPVSTNLVTGTITVALSNKALTQLSDEPMVVLRLTDANGQIKNIQFSLVATDNNSPWNGTTSVVFKNKSFTVFAINIFSGGYNTSLVSDGTMVEVLKTASLPFAPQECIILLAQSPFDRADIITNRIIEADKINTLNNILFFDTDHIICNNNAITDIFPNLMMS